MGKNTPYFLMVAGVILFLLNFWAAGFDTSKLNYFSTAASFLIVVLGFVELKKKRKNDN